MIQQMMTLLKVIHSGKPMLDHSSECKSWDTEVQMFFMITCMQDHITSISWLEELY